MSNAERLVYLPLGGSGEIGMNMYAYGWGKPGKEKWIVVDLGVTFPDAFGTPGVDLIMADTSFLEERRADILGIFITHAHEDHIGAVGLLWHRLEAPVFARKFTAAVVRDKFERVGLGEDNLTTLGAYPEQVELGPFKLSFLPVPHSIPEASGLVIDTADGRVVHTGDLKVDPNPQVGEPFDPALFEDVASNGIKALVCDSTNVFSTAAGRSEALIIDDIEAFMSDAKGMVVATTFASNIARLRTLAVAAKRSGRAVVLMGRAMHRMLGFARATGVLPDFPDTVDVSEIDDIPRDHLFILATGSQGEFRAASAQLSRGKFQGVELREGDSFLFSSKTIPGNEIPIANIINNFARLGVRVVSDDERYHVSGHANRPDLQKIHQIFQPDLLVPMHGEYRHLKEHAALGAEGGLKSVVVPNGTMIALTGDDRGREIDEFTSGRTYLDGPILIDAQSGVVRERVRMAQRGHVAVNVIIEDGNLPLDAVWVRASGLPDPEDGDLETYLEQVIETQIAQAKRHVFATDETVEELVGMAVSRYCRDAIGKKPTCSVIVSRVE